MKQFYFVLIFIVGTSACTGNVGHEESDSGATRDLHARADTAAMVVPEGDSGSCISNCEDRACGELDNCKRPCKSGFCTNGTVCVDGACICDQTTCPDGCCKDDKCFIGTADDHCGTVGQECLVCQPPSQACNALHQCIDCQPQCEGKACGDPNGCGGICSTGLCPTGQVCEGGKCSCNADSCPGGCCSVAGQCITAGEDTACGTGGALCKDCQAQGGLICTEAGSCEVCQPQCTPGACGETNGCGSLCGCPAGQNCVGNVCVCNAASCPDGCCNGNGVCQPGNLDTACGTGGMACYTCTDETSTCGARRSCNGTASCAVTYPATGTNCGVCRSCNGSGTCAVNSTDHQDCATNEQCVSGTCTAIEPATYTECQVTAPLAAATVFAMTAEAGNQRCKADFGADWWWAEHTRANGLMVCDWIVASGPKCQEISSDRWWYFAAARNDTGYYVTWHVRDDVGCPRGWDYDSPEVGCPYWRNCSSTCGNVPLFCCR